jgi:hypothetical protein
MKSIKEILEPFILDDKNHLYSHNAEYLIKQLEENQREFGKELLEKEKNKNNIPTSLDGCPFNYCDSNPKCEIKCRYE